MSSSASTLKRTLALPGAVFMGLGSMVGTGVFISIGLAAGVAGTAVLPAIALAAFVAICNGLSSAQLAAAHPVSGGTYEYGYTYLKPCLGFSAGWMFLLAKSASAATAALGFSGYLLQQCHLQDRIPLILPALGIILVITLLVKSGLQRSNWINTVVVLMTLFALLLFVVTLIPTAIHAENFHFSSSTWTTQGFLKACALMFVAYTGYGRIATMGEEIQNPRRNIPRAIFAVMAVTSLLYLAVAFAAVGTVGAESLGEMTRSGAAPLESILQHLNKPKTAFIITLGALTAMLGVLLNLILGLSRILLAMGRRGDMPALFAKLHNQNPTAAVLGVGFLIALIALSGQVQLSWSFSAFTVLLYYAITNLAALRLPPADRRFPRFFSVVGLAACLFLAFQVDPKIWISGLGLLAIGLLGHFVQRKRNSLTLPSQN
ncbi:amino acid permease [Kiritimatiellota bacterium B12222]|nr:amino acid permease [Kiritimatiellota bacterium B12222]